MGNRPWALVTFNRAQGFFLVFTALGVTLVAILGRAAPYLALSLFGFWELFSLFLTVLRFTDGSRWQRSSFAVSFIGGFLMLLTPLMVVLSQSPLFSAQGCQQFGPGPSQYYCYGAPIRDYSEYYSGINEMVLVGAVAVFGSMMYAIHSRVRILSGVLLLSSSAAFVYVILPTQLPLVYTFVSALTATGGLFVLALGRTSEIEVTRQFAGGIFKVLNKWVAIAVLLVVLLPSVVGGLWGYANEAANSVLVTCDTFSENVGIAVNQTVGMMNPSYLPLSAVWKITYNYTQGLVYKDSESFDMPAHGTVYPRFTFASLELQRNATVNSAYPLIFSYERTYSTLLWSFIQKGSITYNSLGSVPDLGASRC